MKRGKKKKINRHTFFEVSSENSKIKKMNLKYAPRSGQMRLLFQLRKIIHFYEYSYHDVETQNPMVQQSAWI